MMFYAVGMYVVITMDGIALYGIACWYSESPQQDAKGH